MVKMNFPCLWRSWIMECVTTAIASVLVNGCPTDEFNFERGICQGDPLSPFLFLLAAAGLNVMMSAVVTTGLFAPRGYDAIWVIVDRLTKSAHFIPINISFPISQLAEIYIREIVKLHGVPSSIVSDRDPRFTSRFWKSLQEALGSKLRLSSAYHPQTDGQSEITIQSLEDLLRICVLEQGGTWDSHLPLIEFTYNNSYHSSIGMAPFEALYGRRCRTPLCWFESGESVVLGLDIVHQTTEKVKLIQEKMKASQSRQKSYHDKHRKDLVFQEGDNVFLRVTPVTGVGRH